MPPRAPSAGSPREAGYALVVAVIAVAAFGYMAFQVLAADQGNVALVTGRVRQARLAAAADAGLSLAIHGLAAEDGRVRWLIDGRDRRLEFEGVDLTVRVEDERGKAPLAMLADSQARALFAGAGAQGPQLDALVAEFRDWQSDPTPGGGVSASAAPASESRPVRHGRFATVGELSALQDMTPAVFARVAPAVTVFFEDNGPFDAGHAGALARAAMAGDTLEAQGGAGADAPEESLGPDDRYVGRPLTISVVARDRGGAQTHRMEIVEFTGDPKQPYWVRYAE